MGPIANVNGRFVAAADAVLSASDAGVVWGATATTLLRTFAGRPFRVDDHLRRLRLSCQLAVIPEPPPDADTAAVIAEIVRHNFALVPAGGDLGVVVMRTPGPLGYYSGCGEDGPPTLLVHSFPLDFRRSRRWFDEGARLRVSAVRHGFGVDPRAKVRSRLGWWLAERGVKDDDPTASALLLDGDGHVTETAGANLLVVINGKVVSPPLNRVLNGVSLRVTSEMIGVTERPITLAECRSADELLLTNTPVGVCGVSAWDGMAVPWPGPVLTRLMAAWNKVVGMDIAGQARAAGK